MSVCKRGSLSTDSRPRGGKNMGKRANLAPPTLPCFRLRAFPRASERACYAGNFSACTAVISVSRREATRGRRRRFRQFGRNDDVAVVAPGQMRPPPTVVRGACESRRRRMWRTRGRPPRGPMRRSRRPSPTRRRCLGDLCCRRRRRPLFDVQMPSPLPERRRLL